MGQLAEELAPEGEEAEEYLKLFLNCLHLLEQKKRTVDFIKPVFELRMLTMSGYMPDLVGCQQCGEYEAEGFYFFPATGTLVCTDCQKVPPQGSILLTKHSLRRCGTSSTRSLAVFLDLRCLGKDCKT